MRPQSIPLPMVSIRSQMKRMEIFSATPNSISLTMNVSSSESFGDSESNMSDVRECQTKSEVKMKKSCSCKIHPHGAPSRYYFLNIFFVTGIKKQAPPPLEEESYIICITIEDHEKLEMKICIK